MKRIIALIWIVAVLEPGSWAAIVARPKDTLGVKLVRCNATGVPQGAWCGSYTVFEDRAAKKGRTIALNVMVLPATGPAPRPDPVFFLAGGPACREQALSLLASSADLLEGGCVGHIPEILDGDAPHAHRGCGAQAWGATELYRVISRLT